MPAFDYTSRDYYSIKEDLLNRAAELPIGQDWTSRSAADFGVMLVDLWAYMGDVLHFYVDRAAAETYLQTATQRESVLALANLLDYEPAAANSARGQVTFKPTASLSGIVTIPANTQMVAPSRTTDETTVYFVTSSSASMAASTSSVVVNVVEGILEVDEAPVHMVASNNNTSTGTANQKFSLRYTNVIPASVEVSVYEGPLVAGNPSAVLYRYVPRLVDVASYEKAFTVTVSADGVVQIVFGNGVNGKIPNNGAKVLVTYRRSVGSSGNIAANRITSFFSNNFETVEILSSTATTGGYDIESVESIRANAPLLFRTQDRAVSLQDFKDLSLRIPNVVKSTAVNAGSTVTIYPLLPQTDYTSTTFGNSITIDSGVASDTMAYFEPRTVLGASVIVANSVDLQGVYISATINVLDGYVQRWVKDAVIEAIDGILSFDNVSFGQTLSLGEVYRTIMAVEGVDYVNITVFNTSASGIASGNKIVASNNQLLRKAVDYTLTMSGGVIG